MSRTGGLALGVDRAPPVTGSRLEPRIGEHFLNLLHRRLAVPFGCTVDGDLSDLNLSSEGTLKYFGFNTFRFDLQEVDSLDTILSGDVLNGESFDWNGLLEVVRIDVDD